MRGDNGGLQGLISPSIKITDRFFEAVFVSSPLFASFTITVDRSSTVDVRSLSKSDRCLWPTRQPLHVRRELPSIHVLFQNFHSVDHILFDLLNWPGSIDPDSPLDSFFLFFFFFFACDPGRCTFLPSSPWRWSSPQDEPRQPLLSTYIRSGDSDESSVTGNFAELQF